jgi:hypothetical protein
VPINPELLNAPLVTASNVCKADDVLVDGRKLNCEQKHHLYAAMGRIWFDGKALKGHEFARLSDESLEWPAIDVSRSGNLNFITIDRLPSGHGDVTYYHCETNNHLIDIFLPAVEYDALIKSISE